MTTYAGSGGRSDGEKAAYSLKILESATSIVGNVPMTEASILTGAAGWKNRHGELLTNADLANKFTMQTHPEWNLTLTILRGNWNINGGLVAPIGSLGVEANIPLGTIAFRVNADAPAGSPYGIRVIVAVPQCEYYKNENNEDPGHFYDSGISYFGLWHLEANGERIVNVFRAQDAMDKFELPRSNPYIPSATPGESEYILIDANSDNTVESRCYLNAKRVLVAYEFKVTEEGVYVLGPANDNQYAKGMEIVYFSADATASSGRDGTLGSVIGNIDFVYDYAGNVVTVKEASGEGTAEDYHNYYASLCLLYTDNGQKDASGNYISVNNADIYARRFIGGTPEGSQMNYNVIGSNKTCVELTPYGVAADTVNDLRSP